MENRIYHCLCCGNQNAQFKLNHYYFCNTSCAARYYGDENVLNQLQLSPKHIECYDCKRPLLPKETKFCSIGDSTYTLCDNDTCDVWFSCINCQIPTSSNSGIFGLVNDKFFIYCTQKCRERKHCHCCFNLLPVNTVDDYCDNFCRMKHALYFKCDVCEKALPAESRYPYEGVYGESHYCSLECAQKKEDVVACINCQHPMLHSDAIDDFFCGLGCKRLFFSKRIVSEDGHAQRTESLPNPISDKDKVRLPKELITALHAFENDKGKASELKNRLRSIGRQRIIKPYASIQPLTELIPYQLYRHRLTKELTLYITPAAFAIEFYSAKSGKRKYEILYNYYKQDSLKDALASKKILKIPYLDLFLDVLDLRKNLTYWYTPLSKLTTKNLTHLRERIRNGATN